jgi:hypothetical protein
VNVTRQHFPQDCIRRSQAPPLREPEDGHSFAACLRGTDCRKWEAHGAGECIKSDGQGTVGILHSRSIALSRISMRLLVIEDEPRIGAYVAFARAVQ